MSLALQIIEQQIKLLSDSPRDLNKVDEMIHRARMHITVSRLSDKEFKQRLRATTARLEAKSRKFKK